MKLKLLFLIAIAMVFSCHPTPKHPYTETNKAYKKRSAGSPRRTLGAKTRLR